MVLPYLLPILTRLLLLLLLVFIPLITLAEAPNTYEGQLESSNRYCQQLSEKASPLVEKICIRQIKIKYKLSLLMGEPISHYQVYWEIVPNLYLRPGVTLSSEADATGLFPEMVSIDSQAPAVQKAFDALKPIYPTRFVIDGNAWEQGVNHGIYFVFDSGDMALSGKGYSYNTPGSPSWDRFMLGNDYYQHYKASQSLPYLPAEQAKQLYQHLQTNFELDRILELTFSGVSALNAALKSEVLYPLTVNVESPGGSQITILNSQLAYQPGMLLEAGRYHIRVMHPGFTPVEKWISLNAKHKTFSIRLTPASEEKVPATEDKAGKAVAEELETMLAQTESLPDTNDDDKPYAERSQLSDTAAVSSGSLENLLNELGRQDTERLQSADEQIHANNLQRLKNEYEIATKKCNKNKPVRPADYVCNTFHLTSCGRDKTQKECRRESQLWKERKLRECARESAKVKREQKNFPQRLKAWEHEKQQCETKALADYEAAVKQLKKTEQNIDDFFSEIR